MFDDFGDGFEWIEDIGVGFVVDQCYMVDCWIGGQQMFDVSGGGWYVFFGFEGVEGLLQNFVDFCQVFVVGIVD